MKKNHRIVSLLLAALMAIGLMTTAFAAEPTINTGKRASLNIYKYDITTASADGAWDAESYVSTDLHDDAVIDKLAKYAVQGVEFTYLRVADIAMNNELVNGRRRVGVLYGFDGADAVLPAIGVTAADAHKSENGKNYYTSDVLNNSCGYTEDTYKVFGCNTGVCEYESETIIGGTVFDNVKELIESPAFCLNLLYISSGSL